MRFYLGVDRGDKVRLPVNWANTFSQLPNGEEVEGVVEYVNGPVAMIHFPEQNISLRIASVLVPEFKRNWESPK